MSQSTAAIAAVTPQKKVKITLKLKAKVKKSEPTPVVEKTMPRHSVWMTMPHRNHRRSRPQPKTVWPCEDITDDEADEEEVCRRSKFIAKNLETVRRIRYEDQLYDLHYAGLFKKW